MGEPTVERNDGEVAEFTDGGKVIRQRPASSTAVGVIYSKVVQWDVFKKVFAVGLTKIEANTSLRNTSGTDGTPIGSLTEGKKITTNQTQATGAQIAAEAHRKLPPIISLNTLVALLQVDGTYNIELREGPCVGFVHPDPANPGDYIFKRVVQIYPTEEENCEIAEVALIAAGKLKYENPIA